MRAFSICFQVSYYSVLIKYDPNPSSDTLTQQPQTGGCIREVYRVKLPGNPVLGEGKPENQNHALIFSRGRFLQAIDMNQDGYFEEAIKMRNLLQVIYLIKLKLNESMH